MPDTNHLNFLIQKCSYLVSWW